MRREQDGRLMAQCFGCRVDLVRKLRIKLHDASLLTLVGMLVDVRSASFFRFLRSQGHLGTRANLGVEVA